MDDQRNESGKSSESRKICKWNSFIHVTQNFYRNSICSVVFQHTKKPHWNRIYFICFPWLKWHIFNAYFCKFRWELTTATTDTENTLSWPVFPWWVCNMLCFSTLLIQACVKRGCSWKETRKKLTESQQSGHSLVHSTTSETLAIPCFCITSQFHFSCFCSSFRFYFYLQKFCAFSLCLTYTNTKMDRHILAMKL